jgi:sugar transferase (PEP-CTERM system associated)
VTKRAGHGAEEAQAGGRSPFSAMPPNFDLIHRSYGTLLVRIAGQYVPRKSLVLAATETLLIMLSLVGATVLRFHNLSTAQEYLSQGLNWLRFILVTLVCQTALYYNGFYSRRTIHNRTALSMRAFQAAVIALLPLSLLYYLFPPVRLERGILLSMAPLALLMMAGWRFFLGRSRSFTLPQERVLIVGMGAAGTGLACEILRRPELQYKVVGFLDRECQNDFGTVLVEPGIIGNISQLQQTVVREQVDRVLIALPEPLDAATSHQLAILRLQGLPIEDARSMYERLTGRIMLDQLQLSWLILSDGFHKSSFLFAAKRFIDIVVSSLLLVLALPVMLIIALAILLESGRPILFRQERVGLGGSTFQILKYRSMRQEAEESTPQWTADRDPRITRVGGVIRKFRLDELPQLINILGGEMSLIGPRPEVPYFCDLLSEDIAYFQQRHSVRPGLTGWAQVKYQYGASLEEAKTKFEFDLFYIKHMSLLLDLTILFETAKVVLSGKGSK